jgi:hypothetical protein
MKVFLVVVIAATLVLADDDHGEAAIDFKEDTFAEQIPNKPHLVMFFAPWYVQNKLLTRHRFCPRNCPQTKHLFVF